MAALTVTFTDKTNNRTLPTVATEKKVRATDMNELKDAANDHATLIDANTAQVAINTAVLTGPGFSNSNTLDLTNFFGTHHSESDGDPMTDLTFSLAGGVVRGGFAIVYSNAADVPVIYGATSRNDFATNYTANEDNFILVWAFSTSDIYYQLT